MGRSKPVSNSPFLEIVNPGDIERATTLIRDKYGFTPPAEYVRDLKAFVEELTRAFERD